MAIRTRGGKKDSRIVALNKRAAIGERGNVAAVKQPRLRCVRLDAIQQIAIEIAAEKSRDRKFKAMRPELLRVGGLQLGTRTAAPRREIGRASCRERV